MKTICIVGTGASGLVCTKELRAAGFEVTAFDPSDQIGGRWSLGEKIAHPNTGVWSELFFNVDRPHSEFSDFPWNKEDYVGVVDGVEEDSEGVYPHATEARAYLRAYVEHFGLAPSLSFRTRVTSVYPKEGGGWTVVTQSCDDEKVTEHRDFDGCIICVGRHSVPLNPVLDSLASFTGDRVLHSADIKSLSEMDGKRLLVIGGSVSGPDIAAVLAHRGKAKSIVNSTRRVPFHMNRFNNKGLSISTAFFARLPVWLSRYLPDTITNIGLMTAASANWPDQLTEEMTGSPALVHHCTKGGYPKVAYATDYIKCVKEGTIVVKPGIKSVSGSTVTFSDGSSEDFDIILCATGYEADHSLLDEKTRAKVEFESPFNHQREMALYKHTLVPDMPDLAFVGQASIIGASFPVMDMQARYIAGVFGKTIPRPPETKIKAGIEKLKQLRASNAFHSYELALKVQEDIGDEIGVTPSTMTALLHADKLLLGPVFPCYYRTNSKVDGEEVAKKAQERLAWCYANPQIRQEEAKS
jgi:dimethylaniline monooxygenase (N-oxide forming)